MKLKLPKNSLAGIKIYCSKCKKDNSNCKHYDNQSFRMRLHVSGTKNKIKSKVLSSKNYDDALLEAIEFKKEVIKNNYESIPITEEGNDYSIADAILKYYQYLDGNHKYIHKRKKVSDGHRDECIRFCKYFAEILKKKYDISNKRIIDVNQSDVADFYSWAESHYNSRTFNKCFTGVKSFFDFLIDVEEIQMKNPFRNYVSKQVLKKDNSSLTKTEFQKIIDSIKTGNPIKIYGSEKNIRKKMFYPYLENAFKLFLLTGCRREEVVRLRWDNIFTTVSGIKFFKISNLKVEKSNKTKNRNLSIIPKYIPINSDLYDLLLEMGYEKKKNTDDFIICPDRNVEDKTLMNRISKSFTHYKEQAGIEKEVSLNNLRKTYLTWVRAVMMKDTRILSSHGSEEVLDRHYIDPTILNIVEKGALEIKIFGT